MTVCVLFSRLMIEALLPSIQNVMSLQTLMRHMGRDTPVDIKKKLEVC